MAEPVGSRLAATTPIACYRVRSWCHQWLAVVPGEWERARFSRCEDDSSRIVLRPCVDGSYLLQVVPRTVEGGRSDPVPVKQNPVEDFGLLNGLHDVEDPPNSVGELGSRRGNEWFLSLHESSVFVTESPSNVANSQFRLEFDEHGRVRIRGSCDTGYLTADSRGRLWGGTQRPQKWEHFTLIEEALKETPLQSTRTISASVRVTLQAHTGKYLCGSTTVISAHAEAACCCEEFLLDLKFPSLIPVRSSRTKHGSRLPVDSLRSNLDLRSRRFEEQEKIGPTTTLKYDQPLDGSVCTIRTADGKRMLSAEPDGIVFTTPVDQVRGMEKFEVSVQYRKSCPTVSIRPYSRESGTGTRNRKYVSATDSGQIVCDKSDKKQWEAFGLTLANGSRVLIRSIHGGYLAYDPSLAIQLEHNEQQHRLQRGLCSCLPYTKEKMREVGAWQLRYHGDSLYTLVALPVAKGGAQEYLSVDSKGQIIQSGAPAVHFPATASLFEIVPVSGTCLDTMDENICSFSGIVGFTIRTTRRIHGKQRYVSVEPSGRVFATRVRPSRWEIFQFVDVDATASAVSPDEFSCIPAAVNLNSPGSVMPSLAGYRVQQRVPSLGGQGRWGLVRRVGWVQSVGVSDVVVQGTSSSTSVASIAVAEALRRACGVTVEALNKGWAVPKKTPTSLQELCIGHVCWFASTESGGSQPTESTKASEVPSLPDLESEMIFPPILDSDMHELVAILKASGQGSRIPAELIDGNLFNIPDDLLTRIWSHWRSRQPSLQSCKWLPSSLLAQLPPQFHNGVRPLQNHAGRPHGLPHVHQGLPPHNIALWNTSGDGFHCGSCDSDGVLCMDPAVNPAHHRYLEVQYRAYSGARQPGVLWSAISFAGVSLMTTALACRVISLCRISISINGR
ncbi:hypothetical protein MPTK1_4g01550 [Marchantia polymorpha subsp. ruderalis]|uniref:Uncharacterized protein n=2 Tax=Marchantia polymorpha TaxID=3197 RepID=A0AAF6B577_MARPO|nr:hypothetical protein MARPO_0098s0045 [Marchantia polymorpha]BBN07161.1 hypothetical protein Mp_4g01550 [Marchantia polymorpha subsp. ruderalis]|eukprot:PTQ32498.1 hypothetical protein MARPO_0098s0045 [Marchantia polymorpha]